MRASAGKEVEEAQARGGQRRPVGTRTGASKSRELPPGPLRYETASEFVTLMKYLWTCGESARLRRRLRPEPRGLRGAESGAQTAAHSHERWPVGGRLRLRRPPLPCSTCGAMRTGAAAVRRHLGPALSARGVAGGASPGRDGVRESPLPGAPMRPSETNHADRNLQPPDEAGPLQGLTRDLPRDERPSASRRRHGVRHCMVHRAPLFQLLPEPFAAHHGDLDGRTDLTHQARHGGGGDSLLRTAAYARGHCGASIS